MEIVNKVAQSGLITLKLEEYYPQEEIVDFDLKDYLFKGLVLREKDFREAVKAFDWTQLDGKVLALHCSADAIIPIWAYMLVVVYAQTKAARIIQDNPAGALKQLFIEKITAIPSQDFEGKRVVVKGCGELDVQAYAYVEITKLLRPVVQSLMFGEPCSTVPLYKRNKRKMS